jgi:Rad3-related DNA helicase
VTLNRSIDALTKILENNNDILIKPFLNLSDQIDQDRLKVYAEQRIKRLENQFYDDYEYHHAALNNSQRQAIQNALENRVTLIQGPPGTGKTETSSWIIHLWLKNFYEQGQTILVCAETHQAVDNLTRRLIKYQYRLIRYGEPRTVAPDLHVSCLFKINLMSLVFRSRNIQCQDKLNFYVVLNKTQIQILQKNLFLDHQNPKKYEKFYPIVKSYV